MRRTLRATPTCSGWRTWIPTSRRLGPAIEATRAAAERDDANSYLPFLGTDELRQAVVARLEADTGIAYDWRSQCVISAGGLSGILNALLAMLEPSDEVIISDPAYAGLINRIRLAGGVPRLVPLRVVVGGWRLDLEGAGGGREREDEGRAHHEPVHAERHRPHGRGVAGDCQRGAADRGLAPARCGDGAPAVRLGAGAAPRPGCRDLPRGP